MSAVTPLPAASAADCAALTELSMRSKAHWGYDAALLAAFRPPLTITPALFAREGFAVVREGGGFAGLVSVTQEGQMGELARLFVDPAWMGRGYGAALFGWAMQALAGRGATAMRIEADPGAEAFYLRMGARRIGVAPSEAIPGRMLPLLEIAPLG